MAEFWDWVMDEVVRLEGLGAKRNVIGSSVTGIDIPCLYVGDECADKTLMVQGAIHAREYVTAEVVISQCEEAIEEYKRCGGCWGGKGISFVPVSNPDGVRLVTEGLSWLDNKRAETVRSINGVSDDFTLWKANINGVDLNTNFAARWGTGKYNVTEPAPSDYIGVSAMSEPESRALSSYAVSSKAAATVSYHARGRELYWEFFQGGRRRAKDKRLAKLIAKMTGYKRVDGDLASAGGFKDWCIAVMGIPSFTVEILDESTPFPIDCTMASHDIAVNRRLAVELSKYI